MGTILVKFQWRETEMFFSKRSLDYLDYSEIEYVVDADTGEILYKN
jgi:hypothetical protein